MLDLEALTEAKRDDGLQLRLQSVFVEQLVKENPPPLELPKETWEILAARAEVHADDLPQGLTAEMLHELKSAYMEKPSRPVLEVLAAAETR